MYCFLRLTEVWGDLVILLKYYTTGPNGSCLKDISHLSDLGNYSTNNLTYLHVFLSSKQWSVVSQRIKNFGDKPCQEIMRKLVFQKVKSFFILEVNQETSPDQTVVLKNALTSINDNFGVLLTDNFPTVLLLNDIEILQKIAEFIVDDYILQNNSELLKKQVVHCNKNLNIALLYTWFSRISALFKIKRKHNEAQNNKALVTKVFKCFDVNSLIDFEDLSFIFEEVKEHFNNIDEINLKIDGDKFKRLLDMVQFLPIFGLPQSIQKVFFVFVLGLCVDMAKNKLNNTNYTSQCEQYLLGTFVSFF